MKNPLSGVVALVTFAIVLVSSLCFAPLSWADSLPIVKGEQLLLNFKGIPATDAANHNGLYRVDDQGYVEMPLLKSRILAKGKTVSELEKAIAGQYRSTKIYPRISITIQKDGDIPEPKVIIGGKRAGNPGQFDYVRDMKLAAAVAIARPTKFFRGQVKLIRGDKVLNFNMNDPKSNGIPLLPNDVIELVK